ncbi:helix-turn-helix domain-containing protein [Oceanobacillus arenosus]|uniref:Helix-turn-helix domain-containing protein n=1 Tax=Oceanobacillus arenosus TaxID=1229153 RepID=A0A3D8PTU6_9BACI|nr:helix-turn-helix domain-containing protein [Oceanobacillus arenosus]RDW19546.1 helix-turn-helix domain-containing protein [Oceanobacillus arenosus]
MDVGARLKEARLEKGLTLDELQEITKIQKRYLVAIEEGNLGVLPGKFYARAFIKEYATAVGIDSSELLEEHKEEIPKTEEESEIQYTRMERSRKEANVDKSSSFSFLPTIIVVLLVIGIFFVAWYFIKEGSSGEGNPPEEGLTENEIILNEPNTGASDNGAQDQVDREPTDEKEEAGTATDEEKPLEFTVTEEGTGTVPESTLSLNAPDDELIFTFESASEVWLDVENGDGESFYSAILTNTDSPLELDLSGEESIYLNIGSAPNLTFDVNGVAFEYPVDPNERDHQRIWINIQR